MNSRAGYIKTGILLVLCSWGAAEASTPKTSCEPLLTLAADVLTNHTSTQLRHIARSLDYLVDQVRGDATLAATPAFRSRLAHLSSLGHTTAQRLLLELGGTLVDSENHGPSTPHRQVFQNMALQVAAAMAQAVDYSTHLEALSRPSQVIDLLAATEELKEKLTRILPQAKQAWEMDQEALEEFSYLRNAQALDNELGYLGVSLRRGAESTLAQVQQLEVRRIRHLASVRARLRRLMAALRDERSIAVHTYIEASLSAAEENIALIRQMLEQLVDESNPRHRAGLKMSIETVCRKSIFDQISAVELADIAAQNYVRGYRLSMNSDHSTFFVPDAVALASHLSPSTLLQGTLAPDAN